MIPKIGEITKCQKEDCNVVVCYNHEYGEYSLIVQDCGYCNKYTIMPMTYPTIKRLMEEYPQYFGR